MYRSGRHHFFDATSFSMALSSIASLFGKSINGLDPDILVECRLCIALRRKTFPRPSIERTLLDASVTFRQALIGHNILQNPNTNRSSWGSDFYFIFLVWGIN